MTCTAVASACLWPAIASASSPPLPPLKPQASARAVVAEHLDALNSCDWTRLMAQFPPDTEMFNPGGAVVKGRKAVGEVFQGVVQPFKQGGLCGLHFRAEHSQLVGDTLDVQWVAEAPFLAKPYRGADAYVTRQGLMAGQVSTFDRAQIKSK